MPRMTYQEMALFEAELDTSRMTDLELELELRYRIGTGRYGSERLDAIHSERAKRKETKEAE